MSLRRGGQPNCASGKTGRGRAVSTVNGSSGIGGQYSDIGIILQPNGEPQPWEGLQGADSFFPCKAVRIWYGFYDSADTHKIPVQAWKCSLASAPQLAGLWKSLLAGEPVMIGKVLLENPVGTELSDGIFVAVYDNPVPNTIGYSFSRDGVNWDPGRKLVVQPKHEGSWSRDIRMPLGWVHQSGDKSAVFYTRLHHVAT